MDFPARKEAAYTVPYNCIWILSIFLWIYLNSQE